VLGLVGAGCQALQQVDWDGRIGQFSYEQAVAELGRPVEETELSGGMRRAEWIPTRASRRVVRWLGPVTNGGQWA